MTDIDIRAARILAAFFAAAAWFSFAPQQSQAAAIIGGGYYEEQIAKGCGNVAACSIAFSAIPAGKTLIVENVSCLIIATSGASPAIISLKLWGTGATNTFLNFPEFFQQGDKKQWSFTMPLTKVYKAGTVPRATVELAFAAPLSFNCTISGPLK
jgi:hypothetical protein